MKSRDGEPRNKEVVDYKTSIRNEMWRDSNAHSAFASNRPSQARGEQPRGVKWRGVEFSEPPKAWSRESSVSRSSEVEAATRPETQSSWPDEEPADYCFKVVLLGDPATGKSAFLNRVVGEGGIQQLSDRVRMGTVLARCKDPFGLSDQDVLVKVRLWDMSVDDQSPVEHASRSDSLIPKFPEP